MAKVELGPVTLKLTGEEARVLMTLLGSVIGKGHYNGVSGGIYTALNEAGVSMIDEWDKPRTKFEANITE